MKKHLLLLPLFLAASVASAQVLLQIDLGNSLTPSGSGWNNVVGTTTQIANLVDVSDNSTGITLDAAGFNPNANSSGTTAGAWDESATKDSLFGNVVAFMGVVAENPTLTLSNLDTSMTYDFTFFASRMGVTDVRSAQYEVIGATTLSTALDASNNITEVATVSGVVPDALGKIIVSLTKGADNTSANGYFYLGVMTVEGSISAVPEPSLMGSLVGLCVLLAAGRFRRRK